MLVYESDNLKISCIVLGLLSNNVYLLESNGQKALVDPSCRPADIEEFIGESCDKIFITHYHFDHIGAAKEVKKLTGATTYASTLDMPYVEQTEEIPGTHRRVEPCKVDIALKEGDTVTVGNTTWKVLETPGHTPGSICFYCEAEGILMSGDTLFFGSCGRTDFVDGNPADMVKSLRKLSKLPKETKVFPGHGEFTTIDREINFLTSVNF